MPATNGSSTSLSSHNKAQRTRKVVTQNATWRPKVIGTSLQRSIPPRPPKVSKTAARRIHVAYPLAEIRCNGKQGQGSDHRREQHDNNVRVEPKPERRHDHASKRDLRDRIELGDQQRPQ